MNHRPQHVVVLEGQGSFTHPSLFRGIFCSISYDKEADVMYLGFGEPVEAVGEEIEEGVFARYDPENEELAGLTIANFSKKFGVEPREVAVPVHK